MALALPRALLEGEGFSIATSQRPSDAVLEAAESLPQLILSDVSMPGLTGIAAPRGSPSS